VQRWFSLSDVECLSRGLPVWPLPLPPRCCKCIWAAAAPLACCRLAPQWPTCSRLSPVRICSATASSDRTRSASSSGAAAVVPAATADSICLPACPQALSTATTAARQSQPCPRAVTPFLWLHVFLLRSVADPEGVLQQLRSGLKAVGLDCNVIFRWAHSCTVGRSF